jgi:hypothetical protein
MNILSDNVNIAFGIQTFEELLRNTEDFSKLDNNHLNTIVNHCLTIINNFDYVKCNYEIFTEIFSLPIFTFTEEVTCNLLNLVVNKKYDIFNIYREKNKRIDSNVFIKMIRYRKEVRDKIEDFIKLFFDILNIDHELIVTLFFLDIEPWVNIYDFIDKINDVSVDTINLLFEFGYYDTYIKLVENEKIIPTSEHVSMICGSVNCNIETIKYIINRKIIPSHDCIDRILNGNITLYKKYNYYFDPLNIGSEHKLSDNIPKVIDILTDCGLSLTLEDVKKLSNNKITILNFEKYGFEIDNELIQICLDKKIYPEYITTKCFSQERLKHLFKSVRHVSEIMDYIKDREVTYDIECLRNACKIKNNKEIINFLIKQGVEPDHKTAIMMKLKLYIII